MHIVRFTVLQVMGFALFTHFFIAGIAQLPFMGESATMCYAIVANALFGLTAIYLKNWRYAHWIAANSVALGLLGTILGLIHAFSSITPDAATDVNDVKTMVGGVISGMGTALYASLLGVGFYRYLSLNILITGGKDE